MTIHIWRSGKTAKNITFFTRFLLSLNTFCILGPFPWPNKVSTNKADKAELSKAIIEIMFNTNKTEDFNNKHITHRANLYEAIKKWKKKWSFIYYYLFMLIITTTLFIAKVNVAAMHAAIVSNNKPHEKCI